MSIVKNIRKQFAASAVVLTSLLVSGPAGAVAYEMDGGTALTIDVDAAVLQTVTVNITNANFENIAAASDAVDTATLVMAPDSTITDDTAGAASIISDDDLGVAGQVAV